MKTVSFGRQQRQVTLVGLGGEGVLRTYGRETEARSVIRQAVDQGITYFDSARVYSDSEVYYGSVWKEDPALRESIFQTSKSASRSRSGALADLESTLKRLHTGYLDLWQIHDVRTEEDLLAISRPGGALEAFVEAKKSGLIRNIGVTGHHDPSVLTKAVQEWPVDSVLLPVNPVEGLLGGFLTLTLPAARKKRIAVIAMKILGASHYILPKFGITPEILLRYALSFDVTVAIVGCSTPAEVQALAAAGAMPPLSEQERGEVTKIFAPYADRMAFYRGVK
ncbi:MAG: aldo/keto reductase [Proteobacteria bacterium]|nr:aldo/keto reductase [Pseudomonadota bacterium]MBU4297724.1 aldo/keto reductase [Pseudomonadota bacterium]MCG2749601.1 aldo/keto reductase [Desulfobulbaceae bacterium]